MAPREWRLRAIYRRGLHRSGCRSRRWSQARPRRGRFPASTYTTAVERYQPVLSEVEQSTLLGFLAGYRGFTRDAYTLDLRQFTAWCWQHDRRLFDVHRVDIECFARHLEDAGRLVPRSPEGCARSSGSTATPKRKVSSNTHRPCTSVGPGSITSPTSPTSTATSSAPSSSPPVWARPAITPWCRCWR